jgi:hypothetical protein
MTILVFSKFQPSVLATNFAQMQEIKLRKEYSVTYFLWGGGGGFANFREFFFWKFFGHISSWIQRFFWGEISQLGEFSFQKKNKRKQI